MNTLRSLAVSLSAIVLAPSAFAQSACEIPDFLQDLLPTTAEPDSRFGYSVAMHGDVAVVGALGHNGGLGAVYVLRRAGGGAWVQEDRLDGSGGLFGASVATDGNVIVVGAPYEYCAGWPDQFNCLAGAAYVYRRSGGAWVLEQRLTDEQAHDPSYYGYFGESVAVHGDIIAAGVPTGGTGLGRVCGFRYDGSTWNLEVNFTDNCLGCLFGTAVALTQPDGVDDPHLVVGQAYASPHVRVYDTANWFWLYSQAFTIDSEFGRAVAAGGNSFIVGAPQAAVDGMTDAGLAQVFTYEGGSWGAGPLLTASDGQPFDHFGNAVAIDGDYAVVGAWTRSAGDDPGLGAAYAFGNTGDGWQEIASLEDPEPGPLEHFGCAVGVSPLGIIVGAFLDENNGGEPPDLFAPGNAFAFTRDRDTDEDGLLDCWETEGMDVDGDGTIDLDLPALGANPMHKDLFVEVDAMTDLGPTVIANPPQAVIDAGLATGTSLDHVIQAFLDAPVGNPDATTGINLHIEYDEIDIPPALWPGPWDEFAAARTDHFGSPAERGDGNAEHILEAKRMSHRYCIFARGILGDQTSGMGEMPGNDFMISLGLWSTPGGTIDEQAGTFMHELGHTLGLDHGGGDEHNYKPNYYSVMSYLWQTPESWQSGWRLDYSHDALPTLNEAGLVECDGISAPSGPIYDYVLVPYNVELLFTNPPDIRWAIMTDTTVDWDVDMSGCETVARDITRITTSTDGLLTELTGHDDWSALLYDFRGTDGYADGVHPVPSEPEMTLELREELDSLPPPPPLCTADLDGDGDVGFADLLLVLSAWNTPDGDVTGDGVTDFADLLEVLSTWGPC